MDDERRESVAAAYLSRYGICEGYTIPHHTVHQMALIKQFPVHHSDIFVASHPKAGTTWLQQIVSLIHNGVRPDELTDRLSQRFPFIDINNANDIMERSPPRLIKTHLPYDLLPDRLRAGVGKVLYIARNPKDYVVSYSNFAHLNKQITFTGTTGDMVDLLITDHIGFGPWGKCVLSYWSRRSKENLMFLTYEDLHMKFNSTVEKVAAFLGKDLSADQVATIQHHCSFSSMSRDPTCNFHWMQSEGSDLRFMRKGVVGDWVNHLTAEESQQIDDYVHRVVSPSGLFFTYRL